MKRSQIEKYLTPYKLNRPVLTGSGIKGTFDSHGVDIPFVFYHQSKFYMMYVGFDGLGYQTALAKSDDLINWEHVGILLTRDEGNHWDSVGAAGTWILKETNDLYQLPTLKKIDNKYWMVYHSYPNFGYEEGAAEIGIAWCEDEDLLTWYKMDKPILSWKDGDEWERGGLYKVCLIEHKNKYYMYYNAKNITYGEWVEQIGGATSTNLFDWKRLPNNPILKNSPGEWDSQFVSEPCVLKDGDIWLNFTFGFDGIHAQEGLAYSNDLIHWKKWPEPILKSGAKGSIDETHAHKASMIYFNDTLYHFYTAVRPYKQGDVTSKEMGEFRCITLATSKPIE